MLGNLIAFSLRRPGFVLTLAAAILALAVYALPRMAVDVFPELNAPTVVVLTESPGLAADEVERNVTVPIESAVRSVPGVRRVRSSSTIGLSLLWVEFEWGEDIYRARTQVGERLAAARESLPAGTHSEMTPITSVTGEILLMSVSSPSGAVAPMDARSYAEFDLRNQLLGVPGVAQVVVIGGELAEYQVLVSQERLRGHGLSMQEVVEATRAAHTTAAAGYLPDVQGLELPIRQTGRVGSIDDVRAAKVRQRDGRTLTIDDVADVRLGAAPRRGTAADRGNPAVVLVVQKAPGTNTLLLTDAIDELLDRVEPALPSGLVLNRHVMRQTDFIQLAIDNLLHVLRDAAIFVAIILILFLLDVRTTFITLAAIPLSLAVALLTLWALGLTINVMTLGGLAVAIGGLVDDAIIDVENVLRRLRDNAALPPAERLPLLTAVLRASNEIRTPMVYATVLVTMVFLPLLFLQGLEGRFFQPLGVAFLVSTVASLVVALTVTPALCRILLGNVRARGNNDGHGDGFLVRWIQRRYAPTLRASLRHAKLLCAGTLLATVGSLGLASTFGTSFLPEFNEGTFTVFLMAPPGTSLAESDRMARGIETRLTEIPGVRSVVRRTGRAERDEHAEPVSSSEVDVVVEPGRDKRQVRAAIDAVLAGVPGLTTSVGQPIEHRLSHVMSGTPAALAIDLFGDDLDELRALAGEVEQALQSLPGARDVAGNREILITSLPVRYRLADLAAVGMSPADAAAQLEAAILGAEAATVYDKSRVRRLVVRLHESERDEVDDVRNFLLRTPTGGLVRLSEVADVTLEKTSNLITRENGRRKAVVSCNVADGYNLGQLVAAARERVEPLAAARGCGVRFGGQFEAQQSASKTLWWFGGGVIVFMLAVLHQALGTLRAALLVLVNLPLALIGGIAAIYLVESPHLLDNTLALFGLGGRYQAPVVSIASMVGFITLFGIAARNGILLVRHYLDLLAAGVPFDEALQRGSRERLVPILMTALTAALGLLPLVFAAGEPGSEILAPLSVVVLGGLLTSTFLNLVVVPAGFYLLFRNRPVSATTAQSS